MLSYRLGTVIDFHWGFKPVFRYSKPTLIQHLLEKKKKNNFVLTLCTYLVHIKHEQKDKKVKRKRHF